MLKQSLIALLFLGFSQVGIADDDNEHEGMFKNIFGSSRSIPVQNKLFKNECSACHMLYQANLLPRESWEKLMQPKSLANHFGDNAEVDEDVRQVILAYLMDTSDKNRAVFRFPQGETLIHITKLPHFVREHDELPKRMVQGNPKVKSFSNCMACHAGAERGNYDEDGVRIPGYGYWED